MSAVPESKRWTVEEYLAFERDSDERHEFIDGEIYSMTGGSGNHAFIILNTGSTLSVQLRKTTCRAAAVDLRARAGSDYTYPDIVVVCGELDMDDSKRDTLLNPILLVEVLSPSTERYDRGKKFQLYQDIASLQEYVLISQDAYRVERYQRQTNDQWLLTNVVGIDKTLELPSIACTLALADVYDKVDLENTESPSEL